MAQGHCEPRFAAVRTAFERCFSELGETGAAVAVYYEGQLVCDLYGGISREGVPWNLDTLVMPYSVSKPFAALCCLSLVDRGLLDVEDPVSKYWPEFATAGKGSCTVRQLLEHQAGIPFAPPGCTIEDLFDLLGLGDRLAALEPIWPPGHVTAEHAILYGHLCAGLVRRVSDIPFGSVFDEIRRGLGVDLYFGVPDDLLDRCAELSAWPAETVHMLRNLTPLAAAGLFAPDVLCNAEVMNSIRWRKAMVPAVNMHCTARGVAKVYGILANGGEGFLSQDTLRLLQSPREVQQDEVFGFESRWALGFQHHPWVSDDGAKDIGTHFGLGGIGGSSAFGSFENKVGFAYVTRQMGGWERSEAVEEALLESLMGLK